LERQARKERGRMKRWRGETRLDGKTRQGSIRPLSHAHFAGNAPRLLVAFGALGPCLSLIGYSDIQDGRRITLENQGRERRLMFHHGAAAPPWYVMLLWALCVTQP